MRTLHEFMQTRIFSACWKTFRLFEASWSILQPVSAGGVCQIQFRNTRASQLAELRLQSKDCLDHHANYSLLHPPCPHSSISTALSIPARLSLTGDNHKTTIFISFPSSEFAPCCCCCCRFFGIAYLHKTQQSIQSLFSGLKNFI